jgi:hypothetical protein
VLAARARDTTLLVLAKEARRKRPFSHVCWFTAKLSYDPAQRASRDRAAPGRTVADLSPLANVEPRPPLPSPERYTEIFCAQFFSFAIRHARTR